MNKVQQLGLIRKLNYKKDYKLILELSELSEDHLQAAVCNLLDYIGALYWSSPNGSNKSKMQRALFSYTGLRAGVSDLFIAERRNGESGLFLELKHGKGRLSDSQKIFIKAIKERGYCVEVTNNLREAKRIIVDYLK